MGMQKRGRMAEVTCGIVLGGVLLLLVLGAFQGSADYLKEITAPDAFNWKETGRQTYYVFAGFFGLSLLPFLLKDVERPQSAGRAVFLALLCWISFLGRLF